MIKSRLHAAITDEKPLQCVGVMRQKVSDDFEKKVGMFMNTQQNFIKFIQKFINGVQ